MMRGLLIFDGTCGLCHKAVRFLSSIPTKKPLNYVSSHSELGKDLLVPRGWDTTAEETVLLIHPSGIVYQKSAAVLEALCLIRPNNLLFKGLRYLKNPLFDWLYEAIARNRRKWFSPQKEDCLIQLKYGRVLTQKSEGIFNP